MRQNFHQREGQLVLHSCMSLGDGGGLRIGRTFNQESDTSADFISCRATHGGCMSAGSVHASGYNNFSYCVASGHLDSGGGWRDHATVLDMTFNCIAVNACMLCECQTR